ncbi:hypothetical protein GOBAR_AA28558 [Gossypium barbadense]|uniref:C-JID domain-containing protein n=1 Tax=Gossypium barbadense TaxID=3634 RepID=A0A2P5WLZ8_GOSBA|nr:hypothetical protein GOBAR_AA28558 [Gossypium barbadense]
MISLSPIAGADRTARSLMIFNLCVQVIGAYLKPWHNCNLLEGTSVRKFAQSLSSLRELNLRNCNLCEGDIPCDISGLSSLIRLVLSGNNFISIPASLTRLSKRLFLVLSNFNICSLGERDFPRDISGLSSLKYLGLGIVESPSKVCNFVGCDNIRAINCFKLAEKINALTMLKEHIKAFVDSRKWSGTGIFEIIKLGSEIPEWFSQQKTDSSIKTPLPINLRMDSEWIGVACCCIFVRNDASTYTQWISFNGSIFRGRNCRPIDSRGWSTEHPSVKVKKCGIRIVYEKDLEDIKELQCHTTRSSHIHQHFAHNDGSVRSTSHIKRKRNIYEEKEEEEPQQKRMQKVINFITGQSSKKH